MPPKAAGSPVEAGGWGEVGSGRQAVAVTQKQDAVAEGRGGEQWSDSGCPGVGGTGAFWGIGRGVEETGRLQSFGPSVWEGGLAGHRSGAGRVPWACVGDILTQRGKDGFSLLSVLIRLKGVS